MKPNYGALDLKQILEYLYADTVLPELCDVLGVEAAYRFLSVFGGTKIIVPSYSRIKEFRRNIDIYEALCYSNSKETLRVLADKYDVTEVWVRTIFKRMRREYPRMIDFLTKQQGSSVTVTTKRKQRDGGKKINGTQR